MLGAIAARQRLLAPRCERGVGRKVLVELDLAAAHCVTRRALSARAVAPTYRGLVEVAVVDAGDGGEAHGAAGVVVGQGDVGHARWRQGPSTLGDFPDTKDDLERPVRRVPSTHIRHMMKIKA